MFDNWMMWLLNWVVAELWAWGSGSFGQLGIGSENSNPLPQRVEELKDIQIKLIEARSNLSAAISEQGKIFTWGKAKVI